MQSLARLAALTIWCAALPATAQDYLAKPIRITDVNIDPMRMTVDEFGAQVKADAVLWEGIRDAGLKPE